VHTSRLRLMGSIFGGLFMPLAAIGAVPALADLPPGYQVQRIDSPIQTATGGFGNLMAPIGDVNADGKEDFGAIQYVGSTNLNDGTTTNGDGIIWEFSGATGAVLRSVNAGDAGGIGGRAGADGNIFRAGDIGSCGTAPAQVAGQPGPVCASLAVGPPDGIGDILIGAGGVDVGGVTDVGRVYLLDGATLAILKKIDMPAGDRALIAARAAEVPPVTGSTVPSIRGGFGRTAVVPRGLPPCAGNAGIGTCPAVGTIPTGVRVGDITGDANNRPDIIIGSNMFPENGSTAHPNSNCAASSGAAICVGAGRAYVFRGEDIVGSNPATILDTPMWTLKNIAAITDDPFDDSTGHLVENFSHSQIMVGDVGACRTGGSFPAVSPGNRCTLQARTNVVDGKPDFVISSHRSETPIFAPDPQFFESGVSILYDGATGAILHIYNDPTPQANALFGFTTGQQFAVGDLGDSALPDVVIPAMQDAQGKAETGRGFVFSGNVAANMINFAVIDDPTPNTFGRFANPTEGVGDIVGGQQVKNEVLAGQFSAVQTPGKADADFDISFMNPANNQALQTIGDPDAQVESGFGSRVMPLGDLNSDGMLDFASSSVRWDKPAAGADPSILDAGRIYVFRSDANAVIPPGPTLPVGPTGPAGPAGPSGAAGGTGAAGGPGPAGGASAPAVTLAGRTVDLDASKSSVRRGAKVRLSGAVEAFANQAACEPGQSVLIQRRALKSGRFTTFQTVKTGKSGTFQSSSFSVTTSRLYRARVLQSDACEGAQSTRERVTVLVAKSTLAKRAAAKKAKAAKAKAARTLR
jgi:hypothetical protein